MDTEKLLAYVGFLISHGLLEPGGFISVPYCSYVYLGALEDFDVDGKSLNGFVYVLRNCRTGKIVVIQGVDI